LDAEIDAAIGWPTSSYFHQHTRRYTGSLDAAVSLVPTEPPRNLRIGKWWWMLETWSDYCRASVNYENGDAAILEESAEAATPALALCAAALRARAAANE
jgi:hypothetical protein